MMLRGSMTPTLPRAMGAAAGRESTGQPEMYVGGQETIGEFAPH